MYSRMLHTWPAIAAALLIATLQIDVFAQVSEKADEPLDWWGNIDGFLNRQHSHTLAVAEEILVRFPPRLDEPIERRMALLAIDNVMHEERAAHRVAVQEFFHRRIRSALQDIQTTQVEEGAKIWKLYNHGFVVRTPTVTIAFDLVRGHSARAEGFALADETLEDLVVQCDALFISHRHGDHADEFVARAFIDRGKPVVAPPEIWDGKPIHDRITHLERREDRIQILEIQDGGQTLRVVNYPGHQGRAIQNNVPLVFTPEGLSFVQTGDQSNQEDFSWIDEVGTNHRVDVLFPNCWTPDITRLIAGFKPSLVITGHENEMGHTIDHREPHWLTYVRLRDTDRPYIVMTWGESFHYRR